MKTRSLHRQSGFNLIEILIAAVILSIGLLSLAGLQVASMKSASNATNKQQAAFMIHELMERMRSNPEAVLAGNYVTNGVSCTGGSPPLDCGGAVECTPAAIAAYDLYTIQCGSNSVAATSSGLNQQLMNGALGVVCVTPSCETVKVSLDWEERLTSNNVKPDQQGGEFTQVSMSLEAVILRDEQ